jgi:hypothetical protein
MSMGSEWVTDRPNILDSYYLEQTREALSIGPIFGRHHHLAGGCSADNWAFRTFEEFRTYIARSKPGDLYQVWSLPALLAQDMALANIAFPATPDVETTAVLERAAESVKTYLDTPYNEFLALFCEAESSGIAVQLDDIDGYEGFLERVTLYRRTGGVIYVFPFTRIESGEYILVEAKYPNAKGEVPIGGPY